MNEADIRRYFEEVLTDEMAEDLLVKSTAEAMLTKLSHCRETKGVCGWHLPENTSERLTKALMEKVNQPITEDTMLDVINLAAMIRLRITIYGESNEQKNT